MVSKFVVSSLVALKPDQVASATYKDATAAKMKQSVEYGEYQIVGKRFG